MCTELCLLLPQIQAYSPFSWWGSLSCGHLGSPASLPSSDAAAEKGADPPPIAAPLQSEIALRAGFPSASWTCTRMSSNKPCKAMPTGPRELRPPKWPTTGPSNRWGLVWGLPVASHVCPALHSIPMASSKGPPMKYHPPPAWSPPALHWITWPSWPCAPSSSCSPRCPAWPWRPPQCPRSPGRSRRPCPSRSPRALASASTCPPRTPTWPSFQSGQPPRPHTPCKTPRDRPPIWQTSPCPLPAHGAALLVSGWIKNSDSSAWSATWLSVIFRSIDAELEAVDVVPLAGVTCCDVAQGFGSTHVLKLTPWIGEQVDGRPCRWAPPGTIWTSRPLSSKVKPMMKRETSFARYHLNTAISRILVLGLRNLVTVLMMRHAVGGRSLTKPYLIVDLFPHAQIDVPMFCMTVLLGQRPINHLAVSILNR